MQTDTPPAFGRGDRSSARRRMPRGGRAGRRRQFLGLCSPHPLADGLNSVNRLDATAFLVSAELA